MLSAINCVCFLFVNFTIFCVSDLLSCLVEPTIRSNEWCARGGVHNKEELFLSDITTFSFSWCETNHWRRGRRISPHSCGKCRNYCHYQALWISVLTLFRGPFEITMVNITCNKPSVGVSFVCGGRLVSTYCELRLRLLQLLPIVLVWNNSILNPMTFISE